METKRGMIAKEMLATEESYVASMVVVTDLYYLPLRNGHKNDNPILSDEDFFTLFSNWIDIFRLQQSLLKSLKERVSKWSKSQTIGDLFSKQASSFKLYTQYVNNYDRAMTIYSQLTQRKEFLALTNDAKRSPRHKQTDLMAYLIMPIQRIPRYLLLLTELLKNTPETHQDRKFLQKSVEEMGIVATHVNVQKKSFDDMKVLEETQALLCGLDEQLAQPGRSLLHRGPVVFVKAQAKDKYGSKVHLTSPYEPPMSSSIWDTWFRMKPDSSSLTVNAQENALHGGWLTSRRSKQKHYYKLYRHSLLSFADDKTQQPIAEIPLAGARVLLENESNLRGSVRSLSSLSSMSEEDTPQKHASVFGVNLKDASRRKKDNSISLIDSLLEKFRTESAPPTPLAGSLKICLITPRSRHVLEATDFREAKQWRNMLTECVDAANETFKSCLWIATMQDDAPCELVLCSDLLLVCSPPSQTFLDFITFRPGTMNKIGLTPLTLPLTCQGDETGNIFELETPLGHFSWRCENKAEMQQWLKKIAKADECLKEAEKKKSSTPNRQYSYIK
eukprot:Lithocolla_globosa_v1_NODE_3138_length_1755_cov_5.524706.p1 type:complete len:559 gc:universal NODE_3138_length_1755_cov_5.524706:1709-33(-)